MRGGDHEHIENKQSLNEWREIVQSVAAFATATGGVVRIGISPDGRRVGVQIGKGTLEDLANKIKLNTDPPQFPSMAVEGDDDSAVLSLRVEENPVKPVWAFGSPYKRVGCTNQRLSPEETQRLMELTTGRTWDALVCSEFRQDDVDRQAVADFLRRAGQDARASTWSVLENLGLITSEGLNNCATLLFAKNPQRFMPEAQVKCARFRGTSSVQFLDQQTLDGTVLAQAEQALAFVARNTTQGIKITGRTERETVPEYPVEAVREAVANAICHRNYAASGTVQVRIYDDRLEIWNPGMLPPELTVEALYQEHPSRPRNPRLAAALYRARLIEQWGTGTLRIVQTCEARGMPRPEFSSEMGVFIVRFSKEGLAKNETVDPIGLNERQRRAITYVREHGRITRSQYRDLCDVSERQALKDLTSLIERRILTREGQGRATSYVLASKGSMRD